MCEKYRTLSSKGRGQTYRHRIIYVIKHGLQWKDAPREYGPYKTPYNRFILWSRLSVFNKIFAELVEQNDSTSMLDD